MPKKMKIPGWPDALTPNMPGIGSLPGLMNPLAQHPLVNNPLTQTLTGGFDFMKNLWGGLPASVPGFVVPTVDIEELDKRIKDLKAVETWLDVNAQLLRATIQSLEVQRNTIAAIKQMGGSLGGSAENFFKGLAPGASSAPPPSPGDVPPWPPKSSSRREKLEEPDEDESAHAEASSPPAPAEAPRAQRKRASSASAAEGAVQPGLSAGAWLGFLQDQFNKVALAAVSGTEPGNAVGTGVKVAASGGAKKTLKRKAVTASKVPKKKPRKAATARRRAAI